MTDPSMETPPNQPQSGPEVQARDLEATRGDGVQRPHTVGTAMTCAGLSAVICFSRILVPFCLQYAQGMFPWRLALILGCFAAVQCLNIRAVYLGRKWGWWLAMGLGILAPIQVIYCITDRSHMDVLLSLLQLPLSINAAVTLMFPSSLRWFWRPGVTGPGTASPTSLAPLP